MGDCDDYILRSNININTQNQVVILLFRFYYNTNETE